ncbi:MAG: helix-turn-helix transcriptional regulator [Spirochaetaceae bacterium]|nr:helix-turn-helix transcriptional regulator [Spirochaetaceae bacterium]
MCEIVEILGNNIRNLRKESGWTQEKLAEKAEISVPFMTQIELGRKTASLEVIEKIAKALGVSYERLFNTEKLETMDVKHKLQILEKDLVSTVANHIHTVFDNMEI